MVQSCLSAVIKMGDVRLLRQLRFTEMNAFCLSAGVDMALTWPVLVAPIILVCTNSSYSLAMQAMV